MSVTRPLQIWLAAVTGQVVVGHWFLDGSRPTLATNRGTLTSVPLSVALAWDLSGAWTFFCRSLLYMHWCTTVSSRVLKEPRRFFYSLAARHVETLTDDGLRIHGFHVAPAGADSIRALSAKSPRVIPPSRVKSSWVNLSLTAAEDDDDEDDDYESTLEKQLAAAKVVFLFFHGNCGTRLGVFMRRPSPRVELCRALASHWGAHVVSFDYRGFGDSEGTPSEKGLKLDARAALSFVRQRSNAKIIAYGQSLGTAIAATLDVDGVILDAPFPSIPVAATTYPVLKYLTPGLRRLGLLDQILDAIPDHFVAPDVHPSIPLLIVHKIQDTIVPFRLGRTVFEHAQQRRSSGDRTFFLPLDEPKNIMRKHHTDAFTSPAWTAAITDFLDLVLSSSSNHDISSSTTNISPSS